MMASVELKACMHLCGKLRSPMPMPRRDEHGLRTERLTTCVKLDSPQPHWRSGFVIMAVIV